MRKDTSIMWFRQDLRVKDNPALIEAAASSNVMAIYILDDESAGEFQMGGASRVWLHYQLEDFNTILKGNLRIFKGNASEIIDQLTNSQEISGVYWNRCYEPWRIKRDNQIKKKLRESDIEVKTFNGSLLWEPHTVLKKDDTPYRVFTPYYRNGCLSLPAPRQPLSKPKIDFSKQKIDSLNLEDLKLLSDKNWDEKIISGWQPTIKGAEKALAEFVSSKVQNYKEGRDVPSIDSTSKLSPYLHFGALSPNQILYEAIGAKKKIENLETNLDSFISELGWREFSYYLLYHFPTLPKENFSEKFNKFKWEKDADSLEAWQLGQTGCPIVDAGIRELWQTGYMHNRVRMIVGSFLVKNLLIDWREGFAWFWDTLFDADLASNSASWQWVAGTGADASPYFRIFNPTRQGERFDPDGEYTLKFVPELKGIDKKYLHKPWDAPPLDLAEKNIILGDTYPHLLVDLKESRNEALSRFKELPKKTD